MISPPQLQVTVVAAPAAQANLFRPEPVPEELVQGDKR
jgi:hypothetical protein